MNYRLIGNILGYIFWVLGGFLLLPMLYSAITGDGCSMAFLIVVLSCSALGWLLHLIKVENRRMQSRDGYVAVALCWVVLALFGCVPYLLSGAIPRFSDALFETASGLTTTGATILTEVEHLPRSILLWRSETQWMGGMGVLVLFLALMPRLGDGAVFLMRAESPGPIKSKLVPKVGETAKILYAIYVGLTALEAISLRIAGMSWFDAVNHAFTTMATGGFSTHNDGIGGFHSAAIVWIVTLFTFFAGMNFTVIYLGLKGRWREICHNEELRFYALAVAVSSVVITLSLVFQNGGVWGQSITDAVFQVVTLITTTGYATADFALWPTLCQIVLVLCMLTGGCAGSTSGGMKLSRVLLLRRSLRRETDKLLHPNRIDIITIDAQPVEERAVLLAHAFLVAYVLALLCGTVVVSLDNLGLVESITASLTCISNVGPGLGALGPMANFSVLSWFSKIVLSLLMVMGRLELMPLLVLLSRRTWKR